jgi:regulatory protein
MAKALRLLTVRDRTVAELRRRLAEAGFDDVLVEETLVRLGDLGYLDDHRTARLWAEAAQRNCRWFGPRLRNELRRRGVPRDIADELCRERLEGETEEAARMLVLRRYPAYVPSASTAAERQRIYRFLLRRGISPSAAISALGTSAAADEP